MFSICSVLRRISLILLISGKPLVSTDIVYSQGFLKLFLLESVNKLLKYKGLFQRYKGNVQEAMKRIRSNF